MLELEASLGEGSVFSLGVLLDVSLVVLLEPEVVRLLDRMNLFQE